MERSRSCTARPGQGTCARHSTCGCGTTATICATRGPSCSSPRGKGRRRGCGRGRASASTTAGPGRAGSSASATATAVPCRGPDRAERLDPDLDPDPDLASIRIEGFQGGANVGVEARDLGLADALQAGKVLAEPEAGQLL